MKIICIGRNYADHITELENERPSEPIVFLKPDTSILLKKQPFFIPQFSDLGGFNSNRFDIPLLAEELLRAGVDFDMKKNLAVDVQTIFHKKEKRTLEAAYQFYCGKTLVDAHSAAADTNATYEVLKAQLARYDDLNNTISSLAEFSMHKKFADFAGYIGYDKQDREIFNFGKHKGSLVLEVLDKEPGYFGWLLNADFPLYTKKVLTKIKLSRLNTKL
jgi:DNA polymerase-3 subunit epsilon